MKLQIILFNSCLLVVAPIYAEEYLMVENNFCLENNSRMEFKCKKPIGTRSDSNSIFSQHKKWYLRYAKNDTAAFELKVIKEDNSILVLDIPVLYSGRRILYIMKPNLRFYITDVSYHDDREDVSSREEVSISNGRLITVRK